MTGISLPAALGIAAAAATFVCLAALVRLHLAPTGRRPLRDAVSDYGAGRYRRWYRVQTTALGVAAVLLAVALSRTVSPVPKRIVVLLFVFAGARIAIPWYPTDLDGRSRTRTGAVHRVLAAVAFAAIAWAGASLPSKVAWPDMHDVLLGFGWAIVATAVASGLALRRELQPALHARFGLVERLFYAAVLAWFFVVSIYLAAKR